MRVDLSGKKRGAMVSGDKIKMTCPVSTFKKRGVCEGEQPGCVHFPFWLCSRSQFTACLVYRTMDIMLEDRLREPTAASSSLSIPPGRSATSSACSHMS